MNLELGLLAKEDEKTMVERSLPRDQARYRAGADDLKFRSLIFEALSFGRHRLVSLCLEGGEGAVDVQLALRGRGQDMELLLMFVREVLLEC